MNVPTYITGIQWLYAIPIGICHALYRGLFKLHNYTNGKSVTNKFFFH